MMTSTQRKYEDAAHLNMMETATRYGVSLESIKQWRRWPEFPQDAIERRRNLVYLDVRKLDAWLRARPVAQMGRHPHWWSLIWGSLTIEQARNVQRAERMQGTAPRTH